jgi:DNA-binding XRE family transcriptional regulator
MDDEPDFLFVRILSLASFSGWQGFPVFERRTNGRRCRRFSVFTHWIGEVVFHRCDDGNKNSTYIGFCWMALLASVADVAFSYRRTVGQNIRQYRKQVHWSQERLAEKADLSYKFLGEVERGEQNISLDTLFRISKALKTSVADLVRGI